jgi:hypothetical protein
MDDTFAHLLVFQLRLRIKEILRILQLSTKASIPQNNVHQVDACSCKKRSLIHSDTYEVVEEFIQTSTGVL